MYFYLFLKRNNIFLIILSFVIILNIVNLVYIVSDKSNIWELNSVTIWYLLLTKYMGEIILLILPILIIVGSSNNIINDLNTRFIGNLHLRMSKLTYLCLEVIKSSIFGGLIALLPQLFNYFLCLLFFDHSNDGMLSIGTNLGLNNNFQFINFNLIQMFLYGMMVSLLAILISFIIKHKYFYILASAFIYYSISIFLFLSFDDKLDLMNFYSPFNTGSRYIGLISFGYYIRILVVVIILLFVSIFYLYIEKFVEDDLYA